MNFTHRKILFSIFFKPFIHFPGNKYLLEKEKPTTHSILHCSFGPATKTTRPASLARCPTAPRPQPGPRPAKLLDRTCPPGPHRWPDRSAPSILIQRPRVRFARNKSRRRTPPGKTLIHSLLPFLSLRLSSQRNEQQPSDDEREDGVVAGPLAGVRTPQRVSTPPSSGLGGDALIPSKTLDLTRPLLLLLYLSPTTARSETMTAPSPAFSPARAPQRVSAPPSSGLAVAPIS